MAIMTARYAGKCAATGARIRPGDQIDYDRRTRQARLVKAPATAAGVQYVGVLHDVLSSITVETSAVQRGTYAEALADAKALVEPFNAMLDGDEHARGNVDDEWAMVEAVYDDGRREVLYGPPADAPAPAEGRYISDVFRIGGREFYRNKRGRCEDAPCCGCCTI